MKMLRAILNSFQVKEGHCVHSLGAQSISRYCEKRGQEVILVSSPLDVEKCTERVLSLNSDVCGFSSNYVTEPHVIEISRRLKQEKGNEVVIVIGGPSVTYSSQKSKIRQCNADLFVKGDGEEPFYQILRQDIRSSIEGRLDIQGVSSKRFSNETISFVSLDSIPSPFPVKFPTNHVYWETTRGCSFSCIFCAHSGQKNQFRHVPFERVNQEAEYLAHQKLKAIYITDPVLGGEKNRSKKILKLLEKLKGVFITAEYRPEYLDEETLDLLERAQIGWLEFGLQTTNPNLSYFRKNSPLAMEKLERLSKRKIKYSLDLIAGIPGDTRESFEESLKFAIENAHPTSLKVFPLRVYEGTRLHQMAEKDNSIQYDENTRIIKRSSTFDETEFLKWMLLGRTCTHLYKFLGDNNWFGEEGRLRDIRFFKYITDNFGREVPEEYNQESIAKIWRKSQNER